jgi:hypothetical protein
MKKKREDYQQIAELALKTKNGNFNVRVLADLKAILSLMGELALVSKVGHNRQVFGPFRVIVSLEKKPVTEKRTKKRNQ